MLPSSVTRPGKFGLLRQIKFMDLGKFSLLQRAKHITKPSSGHTGASMRKRNLTRYGRHHMSKWLPARGGYEEISLKESAYMSYY